MPDFRPRPWELKAVTVHGGYRPMWEKQVWDARDECWESWIENIPGHTLQTREECEAAIKTLLAGPISPPIF